MSYESVVGLFLENRSLIFCCIVAMFLGFMYGRRYERLKGILAYKPDPVFFPETPHQGLPALTRHAAPSVVRVKE